MGLIAGSISIMLTLIYASGPGFARVDWLNWVEIALIFLFSFGVYRKSRVSSVLLLLYFVSSKIYLWIDASALIGVPMALVFGFFFFQGVRGTFAYHRLRAESTPSIEIVTESS